MKMLVSTFLLMFASQILVLAQSKPIVVSGEVQESASQQPLEFATVKLLDASSEQLITGATTGLDGTFSMETDATDFILEIGFIGFKSKRITDIKVVNGKVNAGVISLSEDAETLEEIVVRGEKSQTTFELDKRVFNVGQDLTSTGANALEVLNNVPSVTVNLEGQIKLRGNSGVQILINGKPSVLATDESNALGTITADMIESIEVITNPSAKYEAEGTSGIINIILKKEERRGTNGSVSLNTGVPHNHSLGLSLNHRTEKFNLFSQVGIGYSELPKDIEIINHDKLTDTTITSTGTEYRNEQYYNFILGADYHINDYNVLTITGNYTLEIEDQPSNTHYSLYTENATSLMSEWQREEVTEAVNPKYQFEVQYKRDFKDHEDHSLLFSAIGGFFGKDQSSDFTDTTVYGETDEDSQQKTAADFQEGKYTFKLDYTKPFSDRFTLEVGSQFMINNVGNDYSVHNLINGNWVVDSTQTNLFEFNQNVLGIYGTAAYDINKWGFKLGLRMENTDLDTYLANTNETNKQNYTNFFPTVHTSYKINDFLSLQAGYSSRIYRPRLWDLNPFFNIRNNYSIRQGNPDLMPELTDSYEIGTVYNQGVVSLSTAVYHRYTTGVIEMISTFEDNVNIYRPENIGTNNSTGVEVNGKYDPTNWLSLGADFNYNYFTRNASYEGTVLDFSSDQWFTRLNTKIKLPADFDIEVSGNYQSAYQTVQSEISSIVFADLGVRKKIMNGKGVLNLSVRDVFASRVEESVIDQPDFYLYDRGQRGRFVTFGFSYGFGKGEAMQYGGRGR